MQIESIKTEHDVHPNGFSICCLQMWDGKHESVGFNPCVQPFLWGEAVIICAWMFVSQVYTDLVLNEPFKT